MGGVVLDDFLAGIIGELFYFGVYLDKNFSIDGGKMKAGIFLVGTESY